MLKSVYAIPFGVAGEMGLGDNTRGYLAVAAVDELECIVAGLGAPIVRAREDRRRGYYPNFIVPCMTERG